MYSHDYFAQVSDHDPFECQLSVYRRVPHLDTTASMQYVDAHVYLTDDILVKVDKASMLNSLETRAPLLDQYLVEYVASLPTSMRLHNGTLKYLLKKIALDMVPPETVNRPKHGFRVPIKQWFRGDLTAYARELLDSPRAQQRGFFNPAYIRNLLNAHASTKLVNFSEAIWALVCLELWFQVYIDEPPLFTGNVAPVQVAKNANR